MSRRLSSSRNRPPTSTRPISSHKPSGYDDEIVKGRKKVISPLEHAADFLSQYCKNNNDNNPKPEHIIKNVKQTIMNIVLDSSKLISENQPQEALMKAKDAKAELDYLQDLIIKNNIDEDDFKTIKYTVIMQLADAFKANQMLDEALHRYQNLTKDSCFSNQQIAYLEIGNIYMSQSKYEDAIKNYQMGINHLQTNKNNRLLARFNHNCGIAQIHKGSYYEALSSFETAMHYKPSIQTAYNLVLCHFVLSSVEQLKEAFIRMLSVKSYTKISDESDILGNQFNIERNEEIRLIMLAARLVASKDEENWQQMHEFVHKQLKMSKYQEAANEFEVSFSLAFLKHRNTNKAIEKLRQIKMKDPQLMELAATNLSFLYYIEQDFENADKYSSIALKYNKYNSNALVNKGNCLFLNGQTNEAIETYTKAIYNDSDCVEAFYNLALTYKSIGSYEDAIDVFEKLHQKIPKSPEILYAISDCYEKIGSISNAIDWMHRLININPTDSKMWSHLGSLWEREGNSKQAFECYIESFKYCPSDIETVSWLGMYFMINNMHEKALFYFKRAMNLTPKDSKYYMIIASCYESLDQKKEALEFYEKANKIDPINKQCIEHLIQLSDELNLTQKTYHYQQIHQELVMKKNNGIIDFEY